MANAFTRKFVYEIDRNQESLIPIFERYGGLSKEGEVDFYYVSMLSFCRTILLMGMRIGDMMNNSNLSKKGV
jgi:hypothetical protein